MKFYQKYEKNKDLNFGLLRLFQVLKNQKT